MLPTGSDILAILENYYATWGYPIVFLAGLIEGTLIFGWFFPGMYLALLAAFYAHSTLSLPLVILSAGAGWFIGSNVNFFFGKLGWHRLFKKFGLRKTLEKGESLAEKHGKRAIFLGHIYPSYSWSVGISSGILKIPYKVYFPTALASILFWTTGYGIVGYLLGFERDVVERIFDVLFWPVVVVTAFLIVRRIVRLRKLKKPEDILP